ncbi:hypothetical protein EYR40_001629 [Pleurotus pulmonarius]|nr:hypothetical protein EYR40_001629 [Pleurotus pulmonarius]
MAPSEYRQNANGVPCATFVSEVNDLGEISSSHLVASVFLVAAHPSGILFLEPSQVILVLCPPKSSAQYLRRTPPTEEIPNLTSICARAWISAQEFVYWSSLHSSIRAYPRSTVPEAERQVDWAETRFNHGWGDAVRSGTVVAAHSFAATHCNWLPS